MRGIAQLVLVQFKLFYREPVALIMTLAHPVLLILLFGSMFGGQDIENIEELRGFKFADAMVPAYTAIIIAITAFALIPASVASAKETRVLRHFQASPIRSITYFTAEVFMFFSMTLVGMVLLILVGSVVFGLRFGGFWPSMFAGFALSTFAFFVVGYLVAAVSPSARAATGIGMFLMMPQIFLSGATIPMEVLPEFLQQISPAIPLTHVVNLLQGLWFGYAWGDNLVAVAVLVGMLVVGTVLSAKTFRWE